MKLYFLLFFFSIGLAAQQTTYKGTVFNSKDKKPLKEVYVYSTFLKRGVFTDINGAFEVRRGVKNDSILFFKEGFEQRYISEIGLRTVFLQEKKEVLKEVVLSNQPKNSASKVVSGEVVYSSEEIEKLPYVLGEKDVIKILQYTPGVQPAREGQSGLLVRGGNGSMNLTYIDDVYLHNPSHLGGLFTAVNSDFVKKLTFKKSSFDASQGGRLASITDISTKSDFDKLELQGSIGILTSKLTVGVPLKFANTDVLISGRRTYLDAIQFLFEDNISGTDDSFLGKGKKYFFYDFLIKTKTEISKKDKIEFLFYNTEDNFRDTEGINRQATKWNNQLVGFNWEHKIYKTIRNKVSISKSNYQFRYDGDSYPFVYNFRSEYNVYTIKEEVSMYEGIHFLKVGTEYKLITNLPKNVTGVIGEDPLSIQNEAPYKYNDLSFYIDDRIELTERLKLKLGLRYTSFSAQENENFGSYQNSVFEPRISLNFEVFPEEYIKFSYQNLYQYVHQAIVSTFQSPIDFYLPSNADLNPQNSSQITISYAKNWETFHLELGSYYKSIRDYTEFKNGAIGNLFNSNVYDDIVVGSLTSFGTELSLQKKTEHFTGMLSYTYSKTRAVFDEINEGNPFPVTFDRPHNLNAIINYQLSSRFSLGVLFSLMSGQTYTPPKDIRIVDEEPVIVFADKNSYRYPTYHRMDVSASYVLNNKKRWKSTLNLTLYNVYNNKNPYVINYNINGDINSGAIGAQPEIESLYPFIPTINWIFSFK